MWASWVSRVLKRALPAVALLAIAAGVVQAKVRIGVAVDDTGHTVNRVHISGQGVTIEADGHGVSVDDSSGAVLVDNGAGMVRLFSDARVAPGERLDGDVVAVFGSAHVAGHVTGSVVAVFGDRKSVV